MQPPTLTRQDDVFLLDLGDGENRVRPELLDGFEAALDQLEGHDGPRALVTHATGKHWSLGLDLEWLGANSDGIPTFVARWQRMMARLLTAPFPTVAAIQGHCFAGGAMISLTHDRRVMRADRGFWCLPEIDISFAFTPGMTALITGRLAPQTAHDAMTTGERYGGTQAAAAGIVQATAGDDDLLDRAVALAAAEAKHAGATLGAIKRGIHGPVCEVLEAGALT
ncbi:MAG TPA: enoyl-CoA hydratase/isomerase family protein [Solirubrobacteraceae bacterium]|jgi:enoyl-CoA hydratase/carnithine racemase